jgi:hypothetical protein
MSRCASYSTAPVNVVDRTSRRCGRSVSPALVLSERSSDVRFWMNPSGVETSVGSVVRKPRSSSQVV